MNESYQGTEPLPPQTIFGRPVEFAELDAPKEWYMQDLPTPDIDDADRLPPQARDIVQENRVLKAAFAHLTAQMGRTTLQLVSFAIDACPPVDVQAIDGGSYRVRVER